MTTDTIHRLALNATTGPYARPPHCEHTDYQPGCPKCRRYQAWSARRQRLSIELGQPLTHDLDEVRDHLRALQRAGMLLSDISQAADVPRTTISGILYIPERRYVYADTARRLLAVTAPDTPPRPTPNLIPAVGTIRRIQALARLGWSYPHIVAATGGAVHRVDQAREQTWVTKRFAAAIRTAYEALSMQRGPSVQTAARATKNGWPPPLAWDDDTIDDPDATPDLGADGRDLIDEVAVRRALTGERIRLTPAEREHAFRIGLRMGMTANAIGLRLGMNGGYVKQIARRVLAEQAA